MLKQMMLTLFVFAITVTSEESGDSKRQDFVFSHRKKRIYQIRVFGDEQREIDTELYHLRECDNLPFGQVLASTGLISGGAFKIFRGQVTEYFALGWIIDYYKADIVAGGPVNLGSGGQSDKNNLRTEEAIKRRVGSLGSITAKTSKWYPREGKDIPDFIATIFDNWERKTHVQNDYRERSYHNEVLTNFKSGSITGVFLQSKAPELTYCDPNQPRDKDGKGCRSELWAPKKFFTKWINADRNLEGGMCPHRADKTGCDKRDRDQVQLLFYTRKKFWDLFGRELQLYIWTGDFMLKLESGKHLPDVIPDHLKVKETLIRL